MIDHLVFFGANVRQRHELQYVIDRPGGYPVCSFCHFLSPTRIRTAEGLEEFDKGDCIFFDTRFPQWYRGVGIGFVNDWADFNSPDLQQLLAELKFPMNARFRPHQPVFISQILVEMRAEWINKDDHWMRSVASLIERLLVLVSRAIRVTEGIERKSPEFFHREGFRLVREEMYQHLDRPWATADFARMASLSPSRFTALYRKVFGMSPMDDLLSARMERAKRLLLNENVSVAAVAERVGYDDVHYFSRLFHRKCGCPPSEYYRRNTVKNEPPWTVG
jgi:AraC-like DNA-binding protein